MKIAEINTCDYGSTGKIMLQLAYVATNNNNSVITFSRKWKSNSNKENSNNFYFGNFFENAFNHIFSLTTGFSEICSVFGTLSLINKLKQFDPDIIHLHNLHGWYISLPILFKYIKENNITIVWTFHDCWPFTGHCTHFDLIGCEKWKTRCFDCPSYRNYPKSIFDNSKCMYRLKKQWFTGVKSLIIVTPSQWLADLVKQSFLKEYPVKVINNGIDLSTFKPINDDIKVKYNCENKYLILGVSFGWGKRKGLDVFIELAKRLDENKYKIMLVGTDENIDKNLPDNIISIHRTQNQNELAKIYSAADLFVNPTREETLGLVNIESLACGTPVLTFNTGGSPETIDETCGMVVEKDDIDSMYNEIINICENNVFTKEACLKKSKQFDMNERFKEYLALYDIN